MVGELNSKTLSPRLSLRMGRESFASDLFEKNVSEAMGFSDGQKEHLDMENEGAMLGLIIII